MENWRNELRVCSPELIDVYFRFGLEPTNLGRNEIERFFMASVDSNKAVAILQSVAKIKHYDGSSKSGDYLDRIRDLSNELSIDQVCSVTKVFPDICSSKA
jgi:hypothetical protein